METSDYIAELRAAVIDLVTEEEDEELLDLVYKIMVG